MKLLLRNHWRSIELSLLLMLVLVMSGCGGGGAGSPSGGTPTERQNLVQPVARTGPVVAVRVGEMAMLDGSQSFLLETSPSENGLGLALEYDWAFTHQPDASRATLAAANSATPSFIADARGVYFVRLVVRAGDMVSQRDLQVVVVTNPDERLTGPANHVGLSTDCANCHDGDPASTIQGKSSNHLGTSDRCEACHTPQGFAVAAFVDHDEFDSLSLGRCADCHDGVIAVGKSEFHQVTDADCSECHNTRHFLELLPDGGFDHANVGRQCSRCHNGTVARGKTPTPPDGGHPVTVAECGFCHTTENFQSAYPDHTGPQVVGNRCDSCHGNSNPNTANGEISASGYPAGHPVMQVDCEVCHSVVTFDLGEVFNHGLVDSIAQPCADCHTDSNSIGAIGKNAGHVMTSADCGACHATSPAGFVPAFGIDHTDSAVTAQRCDNCHVGQGGAPGSGGSVATGIGDAPHTHLPLTGSQAGRDCGDCHEAGGSFVTGFFDHLNPTSATPLESCVSCHDDDITVGKQPSHFPASNSCESCHTSFADPFAPLELNHALAEVAIRACLDCHGESPRYNAPRRSSSHIPLPTGQEDCRNCHETTAFVPSTFAHVGIVSDCSSCHNGTTATGKAGVSGTYLHIPTQQDCSVCHSNTSNFAVTGFRAAVHDSLAHGCEGCHSNRFFENNGNLTNPAAFKSASHLPTTQDCHACHNVSAAAFSPAISPMPHTGITGNCVSCHDGSASHAAAGAVGKTDTAIHQGTSSDCSVCHSSSSPLSWASAFVDHSSAEVLNQRCDACHNGVDAIGKGAAVPPHVPTTDDCKVCHLPGGAFTPAVFEHSVAQIGGLRCDSCHDGTAATGKDAKTNPPHVTTTRDCNACHVTTTFAGARFDHGGISDNCASCHDGRTAPGKIPPPDHVPTTQDCVFCHQTTGFLPAVFEHRGIVDNCSSCHAAGFATPKSTSHVETLQDCGVCHNTSTFVGAVFDHTGIVDNCVSCHDGTTARGKHDSHVATSLDCHSCHTTATFIGGSWAHDSSSAGTCDTCHNNSTATGKSVGHLNTTAQCDNCHTTNAWVPDVFVHDANGNFPVDDRGRRHRQNPPSCTACHGSVISATVPWDFPTYQPDCAACHANDFQREGDHIGGSSGTVSQNRNCGGSGCHSASSRSW